MYKHTQHTHTHTHTHTIILSLSPESSEMLPVSRRVHAPFRVIGHSYTNPVFLVWEFCKVPFGAPTIMLERREGGRKGEREGGKEGRREGGREGGRKGGRGE